MKAKNQTWSFTYLGGTVSQQCQDRIQDNCASKNVFPLSSTQIGDRVVIQQLPSGDMGLRLRNMGLALGSKVEVLSKTTRGSVIVCVRDQQIGLGAGMANQVMVT